MRRILCIKYGYLGRAQVNKTFRCSWISAVVVIVLSGIVDIACPLWV